MLYVTLTPKVCAIRSINSVVNACRNDSPTGSDHIARLCKHMGQCISAKEPLTLISLE